jgi:hypothetical protein
MFGSRASAQGICDTSENGDYQHWAKLRRAIVLLNGQHFFVFSLYFLLNASPQHFFSVSRLTNGWAKNMDITISVSRTTQHLRVEPSIKHSTFAGCNIRQNFGWNLGSVRELLLQLDNVA